MNTFTKILGTIIRKQLIAHSVNQGMALTITKSIIDDLVTGYGGQMFYLINRHTERTAEKHQQILADHANGLSNVEIYQKYRIGSAWLTKLLKRAVQNEPAN